MNEHQKNLVKRQCPGRSFCYHPAATCCSRDFIRLEILIPIVAPTVPSWSPKCETPLTQSPYLHTTTATNSYIPPAMPEYTRFQAPTVCPGGAPALLNAGCHSQYGGCPFGYTCYGGGYCCPAACPSQLVPTGFCYPLAAVVGGVSKCPRVAVDIAFYAPSYLHTAACGGYGSACHGGVCCAPPTPPAMAAARIPALLPQQYAFPTCYNGMAAHMACPAVGLCPVGYECFSGGCCPLPSCRSGIRAQARCRRSIAGASQCPGSAICQEGLCCPAPVCPSGVEASVLCSAGEDNCLPGYECHDGGCCPLPRCSTTGGLPFGRCSRQPKTSTDMGVRTCPGGSICLGGLCCALPVCTINRRPAISFCTTITASASQPSNSLQCDPGYECVNGGCCPILLCSDAVSLPISVCGKEHACPDGYRCEVDAGTCCPHRGPTASATPAVTLLCPVGSYAVSRCSPTTYICPYASSCYAGTCCAFTPPGLAEAYYPGMPCSHSRDCAWGTGENYAQCIQGTCVCVNGGYSNGTKCESPAGQRRVPVASEMPPLFVTSDVGKLGRDEQDRTNSMRRCVRNLSQEDMRRVDYLAYDPDSTCLPSEKCIGDRCLKRLRPGEFGCVSDEHCSSHCPNSYCEMKSFEMGAGGQSTSQCQCRDGLLLYGRCFNRCPAGFQESGDTCRHENEAAFWMDTEAREALERLLSQREC